MIYIRMPWRFHLVGNILLLACGGIQAWETEKVPIRLWEVATGENIATFWGHPTDIQDLAFSPDGTLLASGSFDGTILPLGHETRDRFVIGTHNLKVGACASSRLRFSQRVHRLTVAPL